MADPTPASSKNYVVVTTTGGIHSGHDDIASADSAARIANAEAEKLGLKTRYEVEAKELAEAA
jgi:molybdopterin-biosynthesis enzyme MoeA-like protein